MKNRVAFATIVFLPCLWVSFSAGAAFVLPEQSSCASAESDAYGRGFNDAQSQCQQQISACQQDPALCGITLGTLLEKGGYGETEPNDNMIAANGLIGGAQFIGQSYGPEDEDWYYLVTSRPNQIATLHFSVPWRDPTATAVPAWIVELRDAAGNRYASFSTDFLAGNVGVADEINYPVALGLVGTYYVVVKPTSADAVSSYPYALGVVLQDSDITSLPLVVNFFDAEVEPNDRYFQANPVATGVTMYGLINLRFDTPVRRGTTAVWAQGEDDWYRYGTAGNEIVTVEFCDKETCGPGDWYVEVYDLFSAQAIDAGHAARPIVAYNTDTASESPQVIRFGLPDPGNYYLRVNHKRKFEAPCTGYALDVNNDGLVDGGACACESGYSCPVKIRNPNPGDICPDGSGELTTDETAGTVSGPAQCDATCRCVAYGGVVEVPEGEITSQYNFTLYGTALQPFSVDSAAYEAYLGRPNPLRE